jgi:hypothetical protein
MRIHGPSKAWWAANTRILLVSLTVLSIVLR